MLKFFRRIRLELIDEGNLKRYLIYAVGEILLVMIGILLALQVNNWNSTNNLQKTEKKLLLEMKNNLYEDLEDANWNINALNQRNNDIKLIEKHLKGNLSYQDSIGHAYFRLRQGITFHNNTSAYESIKSMGFDLIEDDQLRGKITQQYSGRYGFIKSREENLDSDIEVNHFIPLVTNHLITNLKEETAKPRNYEELTKNHQFKELLKERYRRQTSLISAYTRIKKEATEIIETIKMKYE